MTEYPVFPVWRIVNDGFDAELCSLCYTKQYLTVECCSSVREPFSTSLTYWEHFGLCLFIQMTAGCQVSSGKAAFQWTKLPHLVSVLHPNCIMNWQKVCCGSFFHWNRWKVSSTGMIFCLFGLAQFRQCAESLSMAQACCDLIGVLVARTRTEGCST